MSAVSVGGRGWRTRTSAAGVLFPSARQIRMFGLAGTCTRNAADGKIRPMSDDSWSVKANMTQGWRAVGGKLAVDDGRIGFAPHAFDGSTGGELFDRPLADLDSVDLAPRTLHPFNGGLRKRLRLRLSDGTEALFVVMGPAKVGERISRSAQAAGGSPRVDT